MSMSGSVPSILPVADPQPAAAEAAAAAAPASPSEKASVSTSSNPSSFPPPAASEIVRSDRTTTTDEESAVRIKPEYLLAERSPVLASPPVPPPPTDDDERGGDGGVRTDGTREEEGGGIQNRGGRRKRNRKRGQNKKRPRDAPIDFSRKICRSVLTPGEVCPWGPEKCRYSHDVKELLADRPPDIAEVEGGCPSYNLTGRCEYGVTCRVGSKHLNLSTGVNLTRTVDDDGNRIVPPKPTMNVLKKDVQISLRKNKYPFVCGRRVPREKNGKSKGKRGKRRRDDDGKSDGDGEGDGNVETKKSDGEGGNVVDNAKLCGGEASVAEAESSAARVSEEKGGEEDPTSTENAEGSSLADDQNGGTATTEEAISARREGSDDGRRDSASGGGSGFSSSVERGLTTTNADGATNGDVAMETTSEVENKAAAESSAEARMVTLDLSPYPAKTRKIIDFRNKVYVAPLTTVGNLPFRRMVKHYGADITCGEMALASHLLEGKPSEWALLKRHPSEDVFGIQIASGFVDQFTRVSELIENEVECDFVDLNLGCPIDLVCDRGAGAALMLRERRLKDCLVPVAKNLSRPVTVKMRTGWTEGKPFAHTLVPKIQRWGIDGLSAIMIHGRSRLQRYQKLADWEYIQRVASSQSSDSPRIPIIGNGDVFSFVDYEEKMALCPDASPTAMLARGALIKPWLPTEIKERRHWDISSTERLDMLKEFVKYGLEHWGSDQQGVNATRRFLLEWLSFLYRYVPVGMLENVADAPQRMNQRPPNHMRGRNDLETLMLSKNCADWIRISEMLLGPVPDGFRFVPKHKANAYS